MGKQTRLAVYNLMRLLLGLLFIFSGFVKCIDPTGGAIKIEDYFIAWGMEWMPWSVCLALSVVQNVLEFCAGFMLVFGSYVGVASLVTLAFMVVFTPLTLYIALANPVSDCGCFGDAVKLTNWQTFGKNLIFLPMAVLVFLWRRLAVRHDRRWKEMAIAATGAVIALTVQIKGLTDEPIVDFRPYSVGTDIRKAMSIPEDAPQPEYKTTFLLEKDGVVKEFDENNYPYDDSTWVFRDSKSELIKEGYVPPIADFTFTNTDGEEVTETLLSSHSPVFMAISYRLEEADEEMLAKMGHQSELARANGYDFFVCTASSEKAFERADKAAGAPMEYLFADETMLRTITRSNPGLIVLQDGVVVAKYHLNHMPFDKLMSTPASTYLTGAERSHDWLQVVCIGLLALLVVATLYSRGRGRKQRH